MSSLKISPPQYEGFSKMRGMRGRCSVRFSVLQLGAGRRSVICWLSYRLKITVDCNMVVYFRA